MTFILNFRLVAHQMYTVFLWIWNVPILTEITVDEYVSFVDKIVHPILPSKNTDPELHELENLYQLYRYSQTCRKYKNKLYRFHFGKSFSKQTIVAKPLPSDLTKNVKNLVLTKQEEILSKFKDYINVNLNPPKVNLYDSSILSIS